MALVQKRSNGIGIGSVREWHWVSSAVCLVGMILFAITGITLNHAAQIKAKPIIISVKLNVPEELLTALRRPQKDKIPLPTRLRDWLARSHDIIIHEQLAEWSDEEVYLSLPRPGGDAWLNINLESGELIYEATDRGWISYFNDLHKGRNTGKGWSWFIDIFSLACLIFCTTGILLLKRYSRGRPTTWPVVGIGLVLPWLLILLFIH